MNANQYLMHIMSFTEYELEANRAGRVSKEQQRKYKLQNNPHVECLSGRVKTYFIPRDYYTHKEESFLTCHNKRLNISPKISSAFLSSYSYTLYYVGHQLIAAEYTGEESEDYATACVREALRGEDDRGKEAPQAESSAQPEISETPRETRFGGLLAVGMIGLGVLIGLNLVWKDWQALGQSLCIGLGILIVMVILMEIGSHRQQSSQDLVTLEGVVTHYYSSPKYALSIVVNGEIRFALGIKAHAFLDGEVYRISYRPSGSLFWSHYNHIVSAEHIDMP